MAAWCSCSGSRRSTTRPWMRPVDGWPRCSGVTLWKWRRDYAAAGVAGLLRARTGPKGPIKLTEAVKVRIVELDVAGLTLAKIAAQTGVSTATVRVALGRVGPAAEPLPSSEVVDDALVTTAVDLDEDLDDDLDADDEQHDEPEPSRRRLTLRT